MRRARLRAVQLRHSRRQWRAGDRSKVDVRQRSDCSAARQATKSWRGSQPATKPAGTRRRLPRPGCNSSRHGLPGPRPRPHRQVSLADAGRGQGHIASAGPCGSNAIPMTQSALNRLFAKLRLFLFCLRVSDQGKQAGGCFLANCNAHRRSEGVYRRNFRYYGATATGFPAHSALNSVHGRTASRHRFDRQAR